MKIYIDVDEILRRRGMGSDTSVQRLIANEVANLSDDYVPFQNGVLKNTRVIAKDGSSITYQGPYAHYHWVGEIYGPNIPLGDEGFFSRAPKKPTGRQMAYDGGPMRGPRWTERMMADRRDDLMKRIAAHVGGKKE